MLEQRGDQNRVIVALDFEKPKDALSLAQELDPRQCRVKVGKTLFTRGGPQVLESLHAMGHQVFLDLKFHDIPNTVFGAVKAAAELGVWMLTVHASGGRGMLEAAREAVASFETPPLLVAVTVLTSFNEDTLHEIGVTRSLTEQVKGLVELTMRCGLDGVVCSAQEATMLRNQFGKSPLLVTPGIRPSGSALGDQQRVMAPKDALKAGANYLVIGRPITAAPDPSAALHDILASLAS